MDFTDLLSINAKAQLRQMEQQQTIILEIPDEPERRQVLIAEETDAIDKEKPGKEKTTEAFPHSLAEFEQFFNEQLKKTHQQLTIQADRFGLAPCLFTQTTKTDKRAKSFQQAAIKKIKSSKVKTKSNPPGVIARQILNRKTGEAIELMTFAKRAEEIRKTIEGLKTKPKNNMIYFVMYDIEDDKVRKKIADYLMEKGLNRVQKSIFLGETHQREYRKLGEALAEIQESYDNHDSIFMVPTTEEQLKNMHIIGSGINFILTLHRTNTVFI